MGRTLINDPASAARSIFIGAAAAVAAFAVDLAFTETLHPSILPMFFAAVVVTAWYAGAFSASVCAIAGIPGILFLSDPRYEFAWKGGDDAQRLVLYGTVCAIIITLDYNRRTEADGSAASREELRQEQNRLQVALTAGQMGTWEWDIPAMKLAWSEEAEKLHGLAPGAFGGTPLHFLREVHPDDRDSIQLLVSEALNANAPEIDMEYRTVLPAGEIRWLAAKGRVKHIVDGRAAALAGVVWDVTGRKRAEIALRETAEESLRAGRMKDEFLGMVSHELRNPITTIYSGAHLLQDRIEQLDAQSRREVLRDLEQEAERLKLIVENLLALAREEFSAKPESEPVAVNRTIDAVISRLKKARPLRKIGFSRNGHAYASIVPLYLDLVLRNVLDNADKYSPHEAPIELATCEEDGMIVISVRDHGPGVPEDARAHLFERFYRVPGARVQGAGMGLTVCRRLLENQGGTIACENHPTGGLVVEVRVPAFTPDEPRG